MIGAGRRYTAVMSAIAVSALQDFFEVLAPTDAVVVISKVKFGQITDVGDSEEEIVRIQSVRGVGSVTSGSGGATVTAQPVEDGDAAFGGTIERNNTTRMAAGSGSLETLEEWPWNVRIPEPQIWIPEFLPIIKPGGRWTFALPAAPADAFTCSMTLYLTEIGG